MMVGLDSHVQSRSLVRRQRSGGLSSVAGTETGGFTAAIEMTERPVTTWSNSPQTNTVKVYKVFCKLRWEEPGDFLRPHLGVEVNPDHALWPFFRKTVGKDGAVTYETLEARDGAADCSGAFMLRPGCLVSRLASRAKMRIMFCSFA